MNDKGYSRAILERIADQPEDTALVATDFSDIAPDAVTWQVLKGLADEGAIERIARGIYYKPRFSALLGEKLPPDMDRVASSLARAKKWSIAPVGDVALNRLGLSEQVPAQWVYLSSGPYACYEIGGTRLEFRHTASRDIVGMSDLTALVVQALKALGKEGLTEGVLAHIAGRLSAEQKEELFKETRRSSAVVRSAVSVICRTEGDYDRGGTTVRHRPQGSFSCDSG